MRRAALLTACFLRAAKFASVAANWLACASGLCFACLPTCLILASRPRETHTRARTAPHHPLLLPHAADFLVSCLLEASALLLKAAGSRRERLRRLALRCVLHALRVTVVLAAVTLGACLPPGLLRVPRCFGSCWCRGRARAGTCWHALCGAVPTSHAGPVVSPCLLSLQATGWARPALAAAALPCGPVRWAPAWRPTDTCWRS